VLVAGGAVYFAISGGKKNPPLNVPADTSSHVTPGNTSLGKPDTTHKGTGTVPSGTRTTPNSTQTHPQISGSRIDVTNAFDLLDNLMTAVANSLATDGTRRMVRDSAQDIFNAPAVNPKDRAYAAYVVSNAYAALDDRLTACQWAQKAVNLDGSSNPYRVLKSSLCGGP